MKIQKILNLEQVNAESDTDGFLIDSSVKTHKSINGIIYRIVSGVPVGLSLVPPNINGTIYLPDTVLQLFDRALPYYAKAERIIGQNVEQIHEHALISGNLHSVFFPKLQKIYPYAFANSGLIKFDIFSDIDIYPVAFEHCQLRQLSDHNQLHKITIQTESFANCQALENILLIHSEEVIIQMGAFIGCSNLKSVTIRNIKSIPFHAFANCPTLENVFLPAGCQVDVDAFDDCVKSKVTFFKSINLSD
ncbi:MAG: leucine-rich repeat protein [Clostridia bacterium]|nr:leucine-rich repeat protein [Clostridia bacterium]